MKTLRSNSCKKTLFIFIMTLWYIPQRWLKEQIAQRALHLHVSIALHPTFCKARQLLKSVSMFNDISRAFTECVNAPLKVKSENKVHSGFKYKNKWIILRWGWPLLLQIFQIVFDVVLVKIRTNRQWVISVWIGS